MVAQPAAAVHAAVVGAGGVARRLLLLVCLLMSVAVASAQPAGSGDASGARPASTPSFERYLDAIEKLLGGKTFR